MSPASGAAAPAEPPGEPVVVHPRFAARRGAVRARSWWGRAWLRSVEESAYGESDLKAARLLVRQGRVGSIALGSGYAKAVTDDTHLASVSVPRFDPEARAAFVEVVAAEAGRLPLLLRGELPHPLVEHADEVGAELLPFAGELTWACTCEAWIDPCPHALALGYQVAWLADDDAFVLTTLRGLPRAGLLAALAHQATPAPAGAGRSVAPAGEPGGVDGAGGVDLDDLDDLDIALGAAQRAAHLLGPEDVDSA